MTVALDCPDFSDYPAQIMRGDYCPMRFFDAPGMNVYGRSAGSDETEVIVVPRASMSSAAAMPNNVLTVDPTTFDVYSQSGGDNGEQ